MKYACHIVLRSLLLTLIMSTGVTAVLADIPQRIISTDAVATEILVALGMADRVIGVDDSSRPMVGSDIPRLGYHRALAAEGMIALAPDLVIGSTQMGPPHVLDALQRSNIKVLQLEPPMSPSQLRQNITQLADVLDSSAALELIQQFDNRLIALQKLNDEQRLSAAFLLRAQGGMLRMAGTDTGGHALIELIGADNLADYGGYRSLSAEALLAMQPDILLIADTEGRDAEGLLAELPLLRFSHASLQKRLLMVDPHTLVSGLSLAAMDEALRVHLALQVN